ncbi:MAG TPA: hypothetical protein VN310_13185 [Candidatus Dormibacteraeota bacterium]|jgi:hypothetical protein|nr:hypothetical protein [Candidatus Dormibacteraeota bacterium]
MRRFRFTQTTLLIAGLCALIFAILAVPLGAQPASEARTGSGIGPVYDAAHEITVNGTIQTVVIKHTKGSPAGMHLMVMGPEGVVDAHVGPFLSKANREALQEGAPVRIVGAMSSQHGKSYLLARELTVGNRTITVRSEHGLLAPMPTGRRARSRGETKSPVEVSGGAR